MQGHELRRFREAHGLTTRQMADIVHVPVARVESWEARPAEKHYSPIEPEQRRVILRERKIQGSSMGSNRFKVDMPRYIEFYLQGRLKLDEMITVRGRLGDVNEAFRAMKAGEVARTVLMFD